MATSSSIKRDKPRLQPIFGFLTPSEDIEIRKILSSVDDILIEFAKFFGISRAGWSGTGLDLIWYPSGQIEISSFVGIGLDGSHRVGFMVSLTPNWGCGDFPSEPGWKIDELIEADCQHEVDHKCMHHFHPLPDVVRTTPIESVIALRDMTKELAQLGKDKPIEYWLRLAGED